LCGIKNTSVEIKAEGALHSHFFFFIGERGRRGRGGVMQHFTSNSKALDVLCSGGGGGQKGGGVKRFFVKRNL